MVPATCCDSSTDASSCGREAWRREEGQSRRGGERDWGRPCRLLAELRRQVIERAHREWEGARGEGVGRAKGVALRPADPRPTDAAPARGIAVPLAAPARGPANRRSSVVVPVEVVHVAPVEERPAVATVDREGGRSARAAAEMEAVRLGAPGVACGGRCSAMLVPRRKAATPPRCTQTSSSALPMSSARQRARETVRRVRVRPTT